MLKKERKPTAADLFSLWEQLLPEHQLPVFLALLKDLLEQDQSGWLNDLLILLTTDFDPPDEP